MAMLQIAVLARSLDFEVAIVTKKFVARCNQNIVIVECNAAQTPVGTAALEVYFGRVPVDVLLNLLFLKIDRKYAAVTLALLAATHDGCRDQCRKYCCHTYVIL